MKGRRVFPRAGSAVHGLLATRRVPLAAGADSSSPDTPATNVPESATPLERTWLYAGDAQIAAPLQKLVFSRLTYSTTDSVTRPFASNVGTPGAMFEVGGEVGLLPRLSLQAAAVAAESAMGATLGAGATAGVQVSLLPTAWQETRLVLGAGYLRELSGGNGAWTRLSMQQDVGAARFIGAVHAEHVFERRRDGLDVMVVLGASYRLLGPLRAGVEYVGQDLEETLDDQAEGGPRHFIGPTAAGRVAGGLPSVVGGPSFGMARAPSVLGRAAVAYSF